MASSEERLKILQMVEDGKLTAEEASKLLKVLDKQDRQQGGAQTGPARWFRVRITEVDQQKPSLDINLPINMVNVGLKMGARLIPELEGLELQELKEALSQGVTGKIFDALDEEDGSHVEVFIE